MLLEAHLVALQTCIFVNNLAAKELYKLDV